MTTPYRPSGRRAGDIAADVEAAFAAGRLPPGARLAPVRALAADLGVAPGTVAAAYRLLAERGVVEGHRRGGTVVRAQPGRRPGFGAAVPPGVRDLARGNPDPDLLTDPGRVYGEPAVLPALGDWARASFAADGIDLPAVTVTGGALDAVERALQTSVRPGGRVAVEDPGYAGLLDLVGALGLVAEPVPIDGDGMTPAGLTAALGRGAQAVVITPRAQNPTGAALTPDRAAGLGRVLRTRPDVLVIEDDHAGPVAGAPAVTVGGAGKRIVVRSASKALGPDLRVALVAGDAATVEAIEARRGAGSGWVSFLLQERVLALLTSPHLPAALRRATATYTARRDALLAALAARGVPATGRSGLNVWVPVADEAAVLAGMAARGWAVAAGARFRISSPPGVRITAATLDPADAERVAADVAATVHRGAPGREG